MVDGELRAFAILNDVCPTVADVPDNDLVSIERGSDHRGSHSVIGWNLTVFPNIKICGVDGMQEPGADRGTGGGRGSKAFQDGGHGKRTCDFSAGHASHAVTHNIDIKGFVVAQEVFVVGADAANIA